MNLFQNIEDYNFWRSEQGKIAFVPTMGNLHEGHLSLVKKAQKFADIVVVSIFVNPLQFAAHEDLDSYPRTLKQDLEKLEKLNVSTVFSPSSKEMYPSGTASQTQVSVPEVSEGLCGTTRPHFFQGVTTVVSKLFNIIKPDYAIFGEKDFQQLLIIKKMVQDLHMPIEIIGAPMVREESGLAMSSRNAYLESETREKASLIYQILKDSAEKIKANNAVSEVLTEGIKALTQAEFSVDYFELRDEKNLQSLDSCSETARLFVAATIQDTRLIDNIKL